MVLPCMINFTEQGLPVSLHLDQATASEVHLVLGLENDRQTSLCNDRESKAHLAQFLEQATETTGRAIVKQLEELLDNS